MRFWLAFFLALLAGTSFAHVPRAAWGMPSLQQAGDDMSWDYGLNGWVEEKALHSG